MVLTMMIVSLRPSTSTKSHGKTPLRPLIEPYNHPVTQKQPSFFTYLQIWLALQHKTWNIWQSSNKNIIILINDLYSEIWLC